MSTSRLQPSLLSVGDLFAEATAYYEIPIYQRNYAWGVEQIEQLIDDIWTAAKAAQGGDGDYFLGNLIVARGSRPGDKNVTYEVIDGQQRLTTLYMLLTFLKIELKAKLAYQSRRTASEALAGLTTSDNEEGSGIHTGFKAIEARMGLFDEGDRLTFWTFLRDNVKLVRVALPEETDLNKYFEIMNTRGQQLQQVDIVKARLMSYLRSEDSDIGAVNACFAWIWDACADMDSYVQMALTPGDTGLREKIFGRDWDRLHLAHFVGLQKVRPHAGGGPRGRGSLSLSDALLSYAQAAEPPEKEDIENRRFESPIKFPALLLHALKVMRGSDNDDLDDDNGQLDDSKLIKLFDHEFKRNLQEAERSDQTKRFAETLLRCKFVLDNFVLKREFTATNGDDGAWSLRRLTRGESASGQGEKTKISARFPNAFAPGKDEDDAPTDDVTREVLLLQSMLRVTYTSPRTMHWLTAVLRLRILLDQTRHEASVSIQSLLRDYARKKVHQAFPAGNQPTGFNIERVVFTYLDYLLAREADPTFTFVYRNSIEHFFPQHADREQENWDRMGSGDPELHMLGNLALVSVGANSKFSNNLPENKVRFEETIRQSQKLELMAKQVKEGRLWDRTAIRAHHLAMVELLHTDLRAGGVDV